MSNKVLNILIKAKDQASQTFKGISGNVGKVSTALSSIAGPVGIAVAALTTFATAVGAAIFKLLDLGSQASATGAKMEAVFGDELAGRLTANIEEMADSLGKNKYALIGTAASLGDLLTPLGMTQQEAAKTSLNLISLSEDMAAFNDVPTAQVIADLQSALIGNHETMLKYGTVINQAIIEEQLLAMGLQDTTGQARELAEVQARLAIITKTQTNAAGAAAEEADNWSQALASIGGKTAELATTLGNKLLPAFEPMLAFFRQLLIDAAPGLVDVFTRFGNVMTGVSALFGDAIKRIADALGLANDEFSAADIIVGAFSVTLGTLATYLQTWAFVLQGVAIGVEQVSNAVSQAIGFVGWMADKVVELSNALGEAVSYLVGGADGVDTYRSAIENVGSAFDSVLGPIGDYIGKIGDVTGGAGTAAKSVDKLSEAELANVTAAADAALAADGYAESLQGVIDKAIALKDTTREALALGRDQAAANQYANETAAAAADRAAIQQRRNQANAMAIADQYATEAAEAKAAEAEKQQASEQTARTVQKTADTMGNAISSAVSSAIDQVKGLLTEEEAADIFGTVNPAENARRMAALMRGGLAGLDKVWEEEFRTQLGPNPLFGPLFKAIDAGDSGAVAGIARDLLKNNLDQLINADAIAASVEQQAAEKGLAQKINDAVARSVGNAPVSEGLDLLQVSAGDTEAATEQVSTAAIATGDAALEMGEKMAEAAAKPLENLNRLLEVITGINSAFSGIVQASADAAAAMQRAGIPAGGTSLGQENAIGGNAPL